jgi:hypothetical protein
LRSTGPFTRSERFRPPEFALSERSPISHSGMHLSQPSPYEPRVDDLVIRSRPEICNSRPVGDLWMIELVTRTNPKRQRGSGWRPAFGTRKLLQSGSGPPWTAAVSPALPAVCRFAFCILKFAFCISPWRSRHDGACLRLPASLLRSVSLSLRHNVVNKRAGVRAVDPPPSPR